MIELFTSIIESLGYPLFLQGTLNAEEGYPDSFFTYWNRNTDGMCMYDNDEGAFLWQFDLNFYSTNYDLILEKLLLAKRKLKENGFLVYGKGHEVISDLGTHTGRGLNVIKVEEDI